MVAIAIYMYRLYDGGAWSTGCTRVASFDRARGLSGQF